MAGRPPKKLTQKTFPALFQVVELPIGLQKALPPSCYPQALEFVIGGVIKK
jgi:hypothetical protein